MDPTPDECMGFTNLGDVLRWAGVNASGPDDDGTRLLALLGAGASEHVRVIGSVPEADYAAAVIEFKAANGNPLPLAVRGKVASFGHACRIAMGAAVLKWQRRTRARHWTLSSSRRRVR